MSDITAFEQLQEKEFGTHTPLEEAILTVWEETGHEHFAWSAAAELSALRARLAEQDAELQFFRATFPRAARNYAKAARQQERG